MFEERAAPGAVTLGSLFRTCSYNQSRLTLANSRVVDAVQLLCSGVHK